MRSSIGIALIVLAIIATSGWADTSPPLEPSQIPSLIDSVRIEGPLDFCNEPVPLDNPDVRERLEKELLLSIWNRPQVILWLKRAHRYFPHIEKMLAQKGMPDDLKYVAVVESALRAHASSGKSAVGYWQFLRATGRRYGLRVDGYIDQRRNIFFATEAATNYLKALYDIFGSWTLAAAAYNTGEKRVESEMVVQNEPTFYRLYLPLETQRYILKILSVKLIFETPEKFGFHLTPADMYPPLEIDRVTVTSKRNVPVETIARASDTYFKRIKDLNPEIRGHYLVKGTHKIIIPKGAGEGFQSRLKKAMATSKGSGGKVYVVKQGDNLTAIAEKFDVPLGALLIWNKLSPSNPIHPGDRLVISPGG